MFVFVVYRLGIGWLLLFSMWVWVLVFSLVKVLK